MGYAIALSVLLIAGSVGALVALRRSARADGGTSGLDAEAEANRWLIRLGGSLVPPGAAVWASAGETAGRELTRAAACHSAARALLTDARTATEYAQVTRTAQEGLRHVHAARESLGLPSEPPPPPPAAPHASAPDAPEPAAALRPVA
ncbi:hypothetical protein ACYF6T_15770 [Streptomyces sp. 7R007]